MLTLLRRADIVAVFAHRSYRCLAAAYIISIVGDAVYFVAVPWHVLNEQGLGASLSFGSAASLVLTAATIPILIMPPLAGVLADRMDRKFLMLFSHVVRMLILAVLIILGHVGELNTLVLAVAAFLLTSAGQLFYPARAAMLPNLLPRNELVAGNAAMAAGFQPIDIAERAAVGFLIAAVGGLNALGVALVMYGLAAWLLSRIEAPEQIGNQSMAGKDAKPHAWPLEMVKVGTRDLAYSVYFIVRHPLLRAIAIAGLTLSALQSTAILIAIHMYFRDVLSEGPESVGTFTAIKSVGMLSCFACGAVACKTIRRWQDKLTCAFSHGCACRWVGRCGAALARFSCCSPYGCPDRRDVTPWEYRASGDSRSPAWESGSSSCHDQHFGCDLLRAIVFGSH